MSEIKGQILGVILVLMIFGVVAGTMTAVFTNLSNNINNKVSQINEETSQGKFFDYTATLRPWDIGLLNGDLFILKCFCISC